MGILEIIDSEMKFQSTRACALIVFPSQDLFFLP
uniref:Uncharacterized protein n=1 Tax=Rhizophora mucronata TaxID=61149 RepID=A0A2P2PU91_RHIMU